MKKFYLFGLLIGLIGCSEDLIDRENHMNLSMNLKNPENPEEEFLVEIISMDPFKIKSEFFEISDIDKKREFNNNSNAFIKLKGIKGSKVLNTTLNLKEEESYSYIQKEIDHIESGYLFDNNSQCWYYGKYTYYDDGTWDFEFAPLPVQAIMNECVGDGGMYAKDNNNTIIEK
tara:strand:- start:1171 stop:1689 length:519 start_codon:yes stop_codon:yes gene_type:complete